MKYRVLFFTSSFGGGGAEKHMVRLLNHIDRERVDLHAAVVQGGGEYGEEVASDVCTYELLEHPSKKALLRMLQAIAPLRALIQRLRPDVVCSVMDHANLAAVLATRGIPFRPQVVLSVQNTPSVMYQSPGVFNRIMLAGIPRLYPLADCVVAISDGVASDVKRIAPAIAGQVEVIYNAGIDDSVPRRALEGEHLDVPARRPLIVACGRLVEQKGYMFLIDAIRHIRRRMPVHLFILGDGPLRTPLQERVNQMGLSQCVRFLGFRRNPYQFMAAADVFVLSSLHEGFGNVIVEAMACGTPVVATDCPFGPNEIITDGVDGILVDPGNSHDLARGLLRVLEDQRLRARFADAGRQRAIAFHAANIAGAHESLFSRLVSGKPRGGRGYR